ncbi:MAG: type II toxin-antitoxin system RelE/ParE family toxin, partial [Dehalococcoidia bacterium]
VKTPPFTQGARIEAGFLLRRLQKGERLGMPHARSMPSIGRRCLELRVRDATKNWRIMLRRDPDAIVILGVFEKRSRATPASVIAKCKTRLKAYDEAAKGQQ